MKPTFKDAADRLLRCITQQQLAEELGVTRNTVARALMPPENPNSRPAPPGWEDAMRRLARRHGGDMLSLDADLAAE